MTHSLDIGLSSGPTIGLRAMVSRFGAGVRDAKPQPVVIHPRCPLRQQIVGPYRVRTPDSDPMQIARVALIGLCAGLGTVGLMHTHDTWMFYVELLISLCT